MKGKTLLIAPLALALWSSASPADDYDSLSTNEKYYTIGSVEVRAVDVEEAASDRFDLNSYLNDCTQLEEEPQDNLQPYTEVPALPGIDITEIVRIGQEIWKIVEANKPVVNVQSITAAALPRDVKCWNELEHWQAPTSKQFEVAYKNLLGIEVVKFQFRLVYSHGGQKDGRGQYIANATIVPAELSVAWGYTFDAEVAAGQAINLGSRIEPVAGLELTLRWHVKTALKDSQHTANFFLQGDGGLKQLNVRR